MIFLIHICISVLIILLAARDPFRRVTTTLLELPFLPNFLCKNVFLMGITKPQKIGRVSRGFTHSKKSFFPNPSRLQKLIHNFCNEMIMNYKKSGWNYTIFENSHHSLHNIPHFFIFL